MNSSFQETQVPAPSRRDPAYHGNMAIDKALSSTTLNTHANFHFQGQQYDRQDPNMEMELSSMIYPAKNEEAGQANSFNGNDGFENNVWDSRAFYTNGRHGMRFDANGLNSNILNSNGIDFNVNGPNGNNTNGPNDIVFDPNGLNGNIINSNGPNGNGYAEAKESPLSLVQSNQPHQSQACYPMDTHMGNAYSNPNSGTYTSTYQSNQPQQQQQDQSTFAFPSNAIAETYNRFCIPAVDDPMGQATHMGNSNFIPNSGPYASTYQTYEAQQQQRAQTSLPFPGNATAETYNHFSIPDVDYPMDHGYLDLPAVPYSFNAFEDYQIRRFCDGRVADASDDCQVMIKPAEFWCEKHRVLIRELNHDMHSDYDACEAEKTGLRIEVARYKVELANERRLNEGLKEKFEDLQRKHDAVQEDVAFIRAKFIGMMEGSAVDDLPMDDMANHNGLPTPSTNIQMGEFSSYFPPPSSSGHTRAQVQRDPPPLALFAMEDILPSAAGQLQTPIPTPSGQQTNSSILSPFSTTSTPIEWGDFVDAVPNDNVNYTSNVPNNPPIFNDFNDIDWTGYGFPAEPNHDDTSGQNIIVEGDVSPKAASAETTNYVRAAALDPGVETAPAVSSGGDGPREGWEDSPSPAYSPISVPDDRVHNSTTSTEKQSHIQASESLVSTNSTSGPNSNANVTAQGVSLDTKLPSHHPSTSSSQIANLTTSAITTARTNGNPVTPAPNPDNDAITNQPQSPPMQSAHSIVTTAAINQDQGPSVMNTSHGAGAQSMDNPNDHSSGKITLSLATTTTTAAISANESTAPTLYTHGVIADIAGHTSLPSPSTSFTSAADDGTEEGSQFQMEEMHVRTASTIAHDEACAEMIDRAMREMEKEVGI